MLLDAAIIGSGPSAQRVAMAFAKEGRSVAIIESEPGLGGACVQWGTLPSKSFRESVYRWSLSSRGTLNPEGDPVAHQRQLEQKRPKHYPEMGRLLRRRDRVVANEQRTVAEKLKRNGVQVYHGHGKLTGREEIEMVSKKGHVTRLQARTIFIAVGARPVAPAHLAVDGVRVHDSNTILGLKKLPKSLIVLGAGIIGTEYASIFATAGTKVYLVDRRHEILAAVDREISAHLVERFRGQRMELLLETSATGLKVRERGGVTVALSSGRKLRAEAVLVALARHGNTANLGLETVGIEPDERGLIRVDRHFRTSVPNIYAVGDVIGAPALASTSLEQGTLAACHALGLRDAAMPENFPYGIYTIPEISMVGLTEDYLREAKADYIVGRARYAELARGQIVGDRWGLLKLIADRKTLRLLGVHVVGDAAANLVHIGQAVMDLGGDLNYFVRTVFNYPTLAEAYKTAAIDALNQIRGNAQRES